MSAFGKRLERVLHLRQIRPAQLARLTGISPASISHYITEAHEPSAFNLCTISMILDVDPIWLLIGGKPRGNEVPICDDAPGTPG